MLELLVNMAAELVFAGFRVWLFLTAFLSGCVYFLSQGNWLGAALCFAAVFVVALWKVRLRT